MKKITLIITAIVLGVSLLFAGNAFLNKALAPDALDPYIKVIDENHIQRNSFIPNHSLIRSANSWYDRMVEEYTLEGNRLLLTRRVVYEYHYPIFEGTPSIHTHEKVLK